jgi:hypothetical protein
MVCAASFPSCFTPVGISDGNTDGSSSGGEDTSIQSADASPAAASDAAELPDAGSEPADSGSTGPDGGLFYRDSGSADSGTVVVPDGGGAFDSGFPGIDAGKFPDGGSAVIDAGSGLFDAGGWRFDAGGGSFDAGSGLLDAGGWSFDAGGGSFDAGGGAVDAGVSGCIDGDGDFYGSGPKCLGPDCDDKDPNINPSKPEICDGLDNDCSQIVDDLPPRPCRTACGAGTQTCTGGKLVCSGPQARPETCDGTDEDCNGIVDDGVTKACSTACGSGVAVCTRGNFGTCTAREPTAEVCGDGLDNDCNGASDDGCTSLNGVFVDQATGKDTSSGTKVAPVATIGKGLALGSPRVYVAGGHYREDVLLADNVSLFGGYDKTFTKRDLAATPSVIEGVGTDPYSGDARGMVAPATVTSKTLVDGFTIRGKKNAVGRSAAVTVAGSPVFTDCIITAGEAATNAAVSVVSSVGAAPAQPTFRRVAATGASAAYPGGYSVGMACNQASLIIDASALSGGKAFSNNYRNSATAIGLSATGCRFTATQSKFLGGPEADHSVGIYGNNAQGYLVDVQADGQGLAGYGSVGMGLEKTCSVVAERSRFRGGNGCGGRGGWGLAASDSMLQLDRAAIGGSSNGTNTWCETSGLYLVRSGARVTNSLIWGGEGNVANAVNLNLGNGQTGEVDLNGNYLTGGGNPRMFSSVSRGINFEGDSPSATTRGVIRNNIINGGAGQMAASSIREGRGPQGGCAGQPRLVENNDLYHVGGNGGLYVECSNTGMGVKVITNVSDLNTMTSGPSAKANLSSDPKLTSEDLAIPNAFHLLDKTSPCYDTGTAAGAPPKDMDGETRPKGGAVDIGPDEL